MGEHTLPITVTEGADLANFWSHHGKHYEGIIKRTKD